MRFKPRAIALVSLAPDKMDAILQRTRGALRQQSSSRSVNHLSGLLDRIRKNNGSKKRKRGQDHRIQVLWMHFNWIKGRFDPVRQRNGGGNLRGGGRGYITC